MIEAKQEGQTGNIALKGDDAPTVRRMLTYLYTLDYDDEGEKASIASYINDTGTGATSHATVETAELPVVCEETSYHRLLNNIAVYAIADRYNIPELEQLAETKFETALVLSDLGCDLPSLPMIMDAVFETTPDSKHGLRDLASKYCASFTKEIIHNEEVVGIVKDHGEIGLAMIHRILRDRDQLTATTNAAIEKAAARASRLKWHIELISGVAGRMKVSESREVQQNYIDAQHRRLAELKEVIQDAKNCA